MDIIRRNRDNDETAIKQQIAASIPHILAAKAQQRQQAKIRAQNLEKVMMENPGRFEGVDLEVDKDGILVNKGDKTWQEALSKKASDYYDYTKPGSQRIVEDPNIDRLQKTIGSEMQESPEYKSVANMITGGQGQPPQGTPGTQPGQTGRKGVLPSPNLPARGSTGAGIGASAGTSYLENIEYKPSMEVEQQVIDLDKTTRDYEDAMTNFSQAAGIQHTPIDRKAVMEKALMGKSITPGELKVKMGNRTASYNENVRASQAPITVNTGSGPAHNMKPYNFAYATDEKKGISDKNVGAAHYDKNGVARSGQQFTAVSSKVPGTRTGYKGMNDKDSFNADPDLRNAGFHMDNSHQIINRDGEVIGKGLDGRKMIIYKNANMDDVDFFIQSSISNKDNPNYNIKVK